jgi:hypothetical protein
VKGRELRYAIYFGQPCLYRLDGRGTRFVDFNLGRLEWGDAELTATQEWLVDNHLRPSCPLEFALLGAGLPSKSILRALK